MLITMCINLWNRCEFSVNHLEAQKNTPPLSTFYSHIKTFLFQLVTLVSHNNQKGYFPQIANISVYLIVDLFRIFLRHLMNHSKRFLFFSDGATFHLLRMKREFLLMGTVDILRKGLFIAVDEFPYSQRPPFYPRFYPRFIHIRSYFDFNRLAVL